MSLMRHEFGHVLQARHFGMSAFYGNIGPSSLWSATKATFEIGNHSHGAHWTEVLANKLSYKYFNQPSSWPTGRFPLTFKNYDWLPGLLGY